MPVLSEPRPSQQAGTNQNKDEDASSTCHTSVSAFLEEFNSYPPTDYTHKPPPFANIDRWLRDIPERSEAWAESEGSNTLNSSELLIRGRRPPPSPGISESSRPNKRARLQEESEDE